MIKIIRPLRKAELISADVFDELFIKNLGHVFDIETEPLQNWCETILGPVNEPFPLNKAAINFLNKTQRYDFFCPGYELISLAPLFLDLRNMSGSRTRLLFIAHAPGAYVMQWALLGPLLSPGDLIIAPGDSARKTIEFINRDLSPYIETICHPMHSLDRVPAPERVDKKDTIATISRIHEDKLIHLQIEAMSILRERGFNNLIMEIAGPLTYSDGRTTVYARSLFAKIARLRLEDRVQMVGPIYGDQDKAAFLSRARMMVSLSTCREEAFPKTSVEALSLGIPVVATRWNGFTETVGECGRLIDVENAEVRGSLNVSAADIADAIEQVYNHPPDGLTCIRQAGKFRPDIIADRYKKALDASLNKISSGQETGANPDDCRGSAAPSQGLLSKNAILNAFSFKELFDLHIEDSYSVRMGWEGKISDKKTEWALINEFLLASTRDAVEHFLAGIDDNPQGEIFGEDSQWSIANGDFFDRIYSGIKTFSCRKSKEMCLFMCREAGRADLLEKGLEYIAKKGQKSRGLDYLKIELYAMKKDYSSAARHFYRTNSLKRIEACNAVNLRQIARISRMANMPEMALPWLRRWVSLFPDSPESGPVWLDRAINAFYSGGEYLKEAGDSLEHAKSLLGDIPVISKTEKNLKVKALSLLISGE